jgi:hypothetical protein
MNKSARVIQFHKTGGPEVLRVEEMLVAELHAAAQYMGTNAQTGTIIVSLKS